jgi:hypothetical protein
MATRILRTHGPGRARVGRSGKKRGLTSGVWLLAALGAAVLIAFLPAAATGANAAANLDQCANGAAPSPSNDGCDVAAADWVNGNLGSSKANYLEGDSIPYRMRFSNLATTGPHAVTIEWDTTKSGKHAIDYIDTYNQSVLNANPCLGVSPCSAPTTFPIPKDPQVDNGSSSPIKQGAGVFTLWGGTITGVTCGLGGRTGSCAGTNPYFYKNGTGFVGDKSAAITVQFTASVANPVLAWGGHIAQRRANTFSGGWGDGNAAVNIPGSPYHTRLIDLDGAGGNQDRSLSADAVTFPGSITIVKDTVPDSSQSFSFTGLPNPPLSNFSLVDDGTNTNNSKLFDNITNFQTYTVAEAAVSHYTLSFNDPVCTVTSANGGTQSGDTSTRTVTIGLKEGENVTCTFINTHGVNSPSIATTLSASTGSIGDTVHDSATLTGATADAGGTVTYTVYTDNACSLGARDAGTKTVTNGSVPDSDGLQFNSAGTFYWQAVYSGDSNNSGATSACTSEQLVIGPNSPSIATTLSATSGNVPLTVHDSATLTGATSDASGTVTYTVYSDNTCSTAFADAGTKTVTNGVVPDSNAVTFNSAGDFYWQASYSGDSNNDPATSVCTSEHLVVNNPITHQITPTATDCSLFNSGGSATLSQLQYSVKAGKINQVSPGVFFYWIKVTAVAGSNTFVLHQAITTGNFSTYFASASGSNVFTSSCVAVKGANITQSGADTTVTFTASSAGTYIIGVKYSASSITGATAPSPTTVGYDFYISSPNLQSSTTSHIDLVKKP